MDRKLQRLLRLAKRTGDRLIVMDTDGNPFVLMRVEQYERLLGSDAGVDTIAPTARAKQASPNERTTDNVSHQPFVEEHRYESIVHVRQDEEPVEVEEIWDVLQSAQSSQEATGWNVEEMNEQELAFLKKQFEEYQDAQRQHDDEKASASNQAQKQPKDTPHVPENLPFEAPADATDDDDDDFEEERFYLEPIE